MNYLRPLILAVPLTFFIVASCSSDGDSGLTDATGGNAGSGGSSGGASGGSKASGGANSGGSKASGGSNNAGGTNNTGGETATGGGNGIGGDGVGGDGTGGDSVGGAMSAGGANGGAGSPSDGGAAGAGQEGCPPDPAQDNTDCTDPGAICQWGQTRCLCEGNTQWNCQETDCPEMRPENSTSCANVDTRACRYGSAICVCNNQDEWQCRRCPVAQPQDNSNCPMEGVTCPYLDGACMCTQTGWICNI